MVSDESVIAKLLKAANKARESREKAKQELLMHAIKQKMASRQRQQDRQTREETLSPQQRFLRDRFRSQNPFAETSLPDAEGNVNFPAEEVVQTSSGKYQTKPISEDKKSQLYFQRLSESEKAYKEGRGPKPSDLAYKIAGRMRERYNKRLGYQKDKEEKIAPEKDYRVNAPTQKFLTALAQSVQDKDILSREDALEHLDKNILPLETEGADTDYIKRKIQALPFPSRYESQPKKVRPFWPDKPERQMVGKFVGDRPATDQEKKEGGKWYQKKKDKQGFEYWEAM